MKWLAAPLVFACVAGCGTLLSIESDTSPAPADAAPFEGSSTDAPTNDGGSDAARDGNADGSADGSDGNAGPKYRVFVTNGAFLGTDMGIPSRSPDARCQGAAVAASLPGTYVAWISTDSLAARNKDIGTGPWFTLTSQRVANTPSDVNNGILDAPINVDEEGRTLGTAEQAWTGSSPTGQLSPLGTCGSWSSDTGTSAIGLVSATGNTFRNDGPGTCTSPYHLYCFQQM